MLYLRKVDEEAKKDAGPQLEKVLEFRTRLIKSNDILFKEYDEPRDFGTLLRSALTKYVVAEFIPEKEELEEHKEDQYQGVKQSPEVDSVGSDADKSLRRAAELIVSEGGVDPDDYWPIVRAHIASSAMYSNAHAGELLDIHEMMAAYRWRHRWELADSEVVILRRSFVAEISNTGAGWCWFEDLGDDKTNQLLNELALDDSRQDVRRGAFYRLFQKGVTVDESVLLEALDDSDDVLSEVVKVAMQNPSVALEEKMAVLSSEGSYKAKNIVKAPYIFISITNDVERGLRNLIEFGAFVPTYLRNALSELDLTKEQLVTGLDAGAASVRAEFARLLYERGILDTDIADRLLKDSSNEVRKFGFMFTVDAGNYYEVAQIRSLFPSTGGILGEAFGTNFYKEMVEYQFSSYDEERLLDCSRPVLPEDYLAMRCFVSKYGRSRIEWLTEMLRTSFSSFIDEGFEATLSETQDEEAREEVSIRLEDLREFISHQLLAASLSGVNFDLTAETTEMVLEEFLAHPNEEVVLGGLSALLRQAHLPEIRNELVELTQNNSIRIRAEAWKVLLKQGYPLGQFISHAEQEVVRRLSNEVCQKVSSLNVKEGSQILTQLLNVPDDTIRTSATKQLVSILDDNELQEFLGEYQEGTYYYNVVALIDSHLFGNVRDEIESEFS